MATSSFKGIVVIKSKKALENLEKAEKKAVSIKAKNIKMEEENKKGAKALNSYYNHYLKS